MPQFAQLENNVVTRLVEREESPGGAQWKPAPADCRIGHVWDGSDFAEPTRHADHATALAALTASVHATSDEVLAAATENASAVEMATWPGKLSAAMAWEGGGATANDHAQLDVVGTPRGLDRAGAAQLILAKAGAFQAAAATCEAVRVAGVAALAAVSPAQPLAAYIEALDAVVAGLDWSL